MIELLHMDCMEYMETQPDKAFDLAIVDPPYGIGLDYTERFGDTKDPNRKKAYKLKQWNEKIPEKEYFEELKRVSKEQIIWGCNFYNGHIDTPGRIIWDKQNDNTERWSHADIASYSKHKKNTIFRFVWDGFRQGYQGNKEHRIHPTQKPVALYKWLLINYAKPVQRILDTHLGSGSSAIASHYFGCDFVGCEIDEDYFNAAKERFDRETRQVAIF